MKYQGDNGTFSSPSFSLDALQLWIICSVPLTLFTLGSAFVWHKFEGFRIKKAAQLEKECLEWATVSRTF